MRGPDSDPEGPEIAGALMAIDATLAGEAVDPDYAELAELALILRARATQDQRRVRCAPRRTG